MNITTERLVLRSLRQSDMEASYAHRSDPKVCRYISAPQTREQVQERIDAFSQPWQQAENEKLILAIALKDSDLLIGELMLKITNVDSQVAEIGYRLAHEYQGQGFGFEATKALMDFGFSTLNLHKISALCVAENSASSGLMKKLGMRLEGKLESHFKISDTWFDGLMFSRLNPAHG